MSDTVTAGPDNIVERSDTGDGDSGTYVYWMSQERVAAKQTQRWMDRGRKIVQRYRDERPESLANVHRFNILWSNVQTLQPTLYARTPKPDVQRRFKDQDDTGRLAAILLERSLSYSLDYNDFDGVMQACVMDRLLPGRGTARLLYVPHYGDELPTDESEEEYAIKEDEPVTVAGPGDEPPLREVTYEEVVVSYVYWEDYAEGPARTWKEVPWVRYKAYMTRDELKERFGAKGAKVKLDYPKSTARNDPMNAKDEPPPDLFKKAVVHEYWDRAKGQVTWIAPGTEGMVLDQVDDPLLLPDFFPSPDPLFATMTTDRRVPVPDYLEYQDQAQELDKLTGRIDTLTRALKVSGVYPGEQKQMLQQLIDEGTENRLIPVLDWVPFADKGGLQNFIQFMPIKEIAATLIQLYDARDRVKQLLYEITGIGDILRGDTVPTETATAQQLKSNFATRRIQPQQRSVARFARDLIRLMGAVIAEHFSAQTISQITGYPQLLPVPQLPPPPPQFLPAPMGMPAPAANDAGAAGMAPGGAAPQMQGRVA